MQPCFFDRNLAGDNGGPQGIKGKSGSDSSKVTQWSLNSPKSCRTQHGRLCSSVPPSALQSFRSFLSFVFRTSISKKDTALFQEWQRNGSEAWCRRIAQGCAAEVAAEAGSAGNMYAQAACKESKAREVYPRCGWIHHPGTFQADLSARRANVMPVALSLWVAVMFLWVVVRAYERERHFG